MGQKERIPLLSAAQKDPVHISASVWMKGSKVLCGVPGPRRTAVQTTTECVLSNAVMIGRVQVLSHLRNVPGIATRNPGIATRNKKLLVASCS